jgi:hypothetical protein
VKQGWSVRIEGRVDRPVDLEDLFERLQPHHPAVSGRAGDLSAAVTVDATNALQAIEMARDIVLASVKPAKLDVDDIEAMTEERQERELERSNAPDLVGIAEIAGMADRPRQRAFQMTANRGFPQPVLELAAGRLWRRDAIEDYLSTQAERAVHRKSGGDLRRKTAGLIDRKVG